MILQAEHNPVNQVAGTSQAARVVYATPGKVWVRDLRINLNASVEQAILASGFLSEFIGMDLNSLSLGVFGIKVGLNQILKDGDRIEIYRPLSYDPKQSRRRRAIHRQKVRNIKKKVPINDVTV